MATTPKKVLVVDDEQDLRDAIATALSYEGFEVGTAGDGIEAVAKAQAMKPDMILLDIIMPKQDGIATLKAIKQEAWGKDIPVVIMTVLDDMSKLAEAIEAGAAEYLVKTDIALGTIVQKVRDRLGEVEK
jgi:two-component system, OmpR family, response regulator MprA